MASPPRSPRRSPLARRGEATPAAVGEVNYHYACSGPPEEAREALRVITADLARGGQAAREVELLFEAGDHVWGQPLLDAVSGHARSLETLILHGGNPAAGAAVLRGLGRMEELDFLRVGAGSFRGGLGDALGLFPKLTHLELAGANNATVRSIAGKHSITGLRLDDCDIDDDALEVLGGMPDLRDIVLHMADGAPASITARGLNELTKKPSLRRAEVLNLPRGFGFGEVVAEWRHPRGGRSTRLTRVIVSSAGAP